VLFSSHRHEAVEDDVVTQARRRGEAREVSASTPTMTIGEVLAVLKPEFGDVTVSKLRFLEGAGLVTPDRTAAGYRKFSEDDIERLRFVLRAQRDQYLPLRVIRQRLQDLERAGGVQAVRGAGPARPRRGGPDPADADAGTGTGGDVEQAAAAHPGALPRRGGDGQVGSERFSRDELCKAAGVDHADLAALESFGLISPRGGDRGAVYTPEDLLILRVAAELSVFGLEPRHLRMYKTFAEREAVLFEQVAAPLTRQRNPEARTRARDTVERLARLCGQLHHAVLANALRGWQQDPPQ
jgi:DNA-binding transcriptional MerR regulator